MTEFWWPVLGTMTVRNINRAPNTKSDGLTVAQEAG
jgi:hypothetical protein